MKTLLNNDLALILVVTLLVSRIKFLITNNIFKAFLVNFTGVLLHELSHFLVGFISGARPYSISLIPHKNKDNSYTMCSVNFLNLNYFNSFPTAMAPLLLLIVAYYLRIWFFKYFDLYFIPNQILYLFLMAILVDNGVPSWQDFKVGFYFIKGIFIWIALGITAYFIVCKI